MTYFLTNWKTTALGVGGLLTALGHLLTATGHGDFSSIATDLPAILTAGGLLFAKDAAPTK